jgi:uncharacterized protein involved in exopolysaccharide biosynthesis/Mrp family chromosome partitioning ATPase
MDLAYLFRILLKRKWIIIGSAFLAALLAWFITRNEPKSYRSSTRVSTGFSVPDEIKMNENSNFSMFDAEVRFNNAINTWTSTGVVSLLSYQLILHDLESSSPFRNLTAAQRQSAFYKSINIPQAIKTYRDKLETMSVLTSYKPEEKTLLEFLNLYGYSYKYITQHFLIYQVQRTDYIQIDCTTENPELSAFIVNNLFKEFIRYYRSIRSTKSQESVDTLQNIMEKKKQEWDDKTRILKGEGSLDATTENSSRLDLISELEKTATDESSKQTDYYYQLRRINQRLGTGGATDPRPANDPNSENDERKTMNQVYSQYLKTNDSAMLNKYNRLKTEYNNKYGQSASTDTRTPVNRADLLEKKNDLEVSIEASKAKEQEIERKIAALKASVNSTSSKGANVEALNSEAKLAEKEYLQAKQKYNDALDISASSANNFRMLQIAQPALEPEPSKRMIIVGMAGALTFLSAVLIIVLVTYLDSSIRTPAIFSKTVRLKLISMVNFMNMKSQVMKDIVTGAHHDASQSEKRQNNVFRESIRKLRFQIESTGKQIFLFTSTKKGQGKTTLIMALSYSMSLSKKKILIIDTNFSNNDLTVNLHADPILEKMSSEQTSKPIIEQIKFFAKNAGVDNVSIIGSEGGDYTPSEVLPRENILTHLHELTKEFDYIFLEGPPLNDFSDSRELVSYVDGVVGVFSATSVIKQIDKDSMEFFHNLNGKFCGSVLNKIDLENVNVI